MPAEAKVAKVEMNASQPASPPLTERQEARRRRILHASAQLASRGGFDAVQMRARAEETYDNGFAIMTKETQRAQGKATVPGMRSTVVGFRNHGGWEFWVQHREVKAVGNTGNTIQIRSVLRLH